MAEIARTPEKQTLGLSHRDNLELDRGMLFLFDSVSIYPFWMKDTKIPLDIIWLHDHVVVDQTSLNPQTGDLIPQYTPTQPANAVLELNRNSIENHKIRVGSTLDWDDC